MPPQRRGAAGASRVAAMTLDATGTLHDSTIMGGRLPQLAYETHLAGGALNGAAPTAASRTSIRPRSSNRQELDGNVTGTLNVTVQIADITAPITPEAITADGTRHAGEVDGRRAGDRHAPTSRAGMRRRSPT